MFAGRNSANYMLHYTKTCKFSIQHKCQINGQFSKKSDKIICLIEWFANEIESYPDLQQCAFKNVEKLPYFSTLLPHPLFYNIAIWQNYQNY